MNFKDYLGEKKETKKQKKYHWDFHAALRSGKLKKPKTCSKCNKSSENIEAHHSNYDKPMQVVWVCTSCHNKMHPRGKGNK